MRCHVSSSNHSLRCPHAQVKVLTTRTPVQTAVHSAPSVSPQLHVPLRAHTKYDSNDVWSPATEASRSSNSPLLQGGARPTPSRISGPRQPNSAVLTANITAATSWKRLQVCCQLSSSHLNAIHISAALSRLAKLQPFATRSSLSRNSSTQLGGDAAGAGTVSSVCCEFVCWLVRRAREHLPDLGPRALANILWSASRLHQRLVEDSVVRAAPFSTPTQQQPRRQAGQGHERRADHYQASPSSQQRVASPSLLPSVPPCSPSASTATVPACTAAAAATLQLALDVAERAGEVACSFEPQQTSSMLYALATLSTAGAAASPGTTLSHNLSPGDHSRPVMPEASYSVPHDALGQKCRMLATPLIAECAPRLPTFGPQALSNTAYAVAVLQVEPSEEWMDAFADRSLQVLPDFEPQHISNTLWALACVRYYPGDEWLRTASSAAAAKLPVFTPQGLSTLVWSLASLEFSQLPPGMLDCVCREVVEQLRAFQPQDMSLMLWGLARLHTSGSISNGLPTVSQAAHPQSHRLPPSRPADELTGAGSSTPQPRMPLFAKTRQDATSTNASSSSSSSTWLSRAVVALLMSRPPDFLNRQQLCNVTWALDRLNMLRPHTSTSDVGVETGPSSGHGSPQHVISTPAMWHSRAIAAAAAQHLSAFTPVEISGLLGAFGRSAYDPGDAWWASCFAATAAKLGAFDAQQLSVALWTLATLRVVPPMRPWLMPALQRYTAVLPRASRQSAAMVMWAVARMGVRVPLSWHRRLVAHLLMGPVHAAAGAQVSAAPSGEEQPQGWSSSEQTQLPIVAGSHPSTSASGCAPCRTPDNEAGGAAGMDAVGACGSTTPVIGLGDVPAMCMTLWSLARLRRRWPADMVGALVNALQPHLPHCTAQSLSSAMWALSMFQGPPPPEAFMAAVAARLTQLLAVSQHCDNSPVSTASSRAGPAPGKTSGQAVATILCAMAVLGYHPGLACVVQAEAALAARVPTLRLPHIARALWAFAQMRHAPDPAWLQRMLRRWRRLRTVSKAGAPLDDSTMSMMRAACSAWGVADEVAVL